MIFISLMDNQDQDTDPGVECVSLCCSSGDETDSTKATASTTAENVRSSFVLKIALKCNTVCLYS